MLNAARLGDFLADSPLPAEARAAASSSALLRHLRGYAESTGLLEHVRLGARVLAARWDAGLLRWSIEWEEQGGEGRQTTVAGLLLLCRGSRSSPAPLNVPVSEGIRMHICMHSRKCMAAGGGMS